MRSYSFEVDGKKYVGTTAAATDQFEALHLVGRTGLLGVIRDTAQAEAVVVVMLGTLSLEDLKRLVALLVTDKVLTAESVPIAENLFQDSIENYYLIIAMVVLENLRGFSKLRSRIGAQAAGQKAES